MEKDRKKVICAMSGGVDSSVAAALLKREGFEVEGLYARLDRENKKVEARAKGVAKILGIPFFILDLRKEFKKKIKDRFVDDFKKGLTPNPCVVCNKEIKFGLILEKALKLGADFVATGHYAKKNNNSKLKVQKLLTGKDKSKDQSYFLWKLNQKQLKRVLFPIGEYLRSDVEKMAKELKLPFSGVKKSQEICFVPDSLEKFLKEYLKKNPGDIVDEKGKKMGKHSGLWFYTLGQRKGIGLSGGPYYVIDKDFKRKFLIISRNEEDLLKKELEFNDVNWISGKEPDFPFEVKAKIRYRSQSASATIYKLKTKSYKLIFKFPQRAITPGQSAVFYKGEELLGGGTIKL